MSSPHSVRHLVVWKTRVAAEHAVSESLELSSRESVATSTLIPFLHGCTYQLRGPLPLPAVSSCLHVTYFYILKG